MKILLIVIGALGLLLGVLSYFENRHRVENRKKSIIVMGLFIIVIVVGIFINPNKVKDENGINTKPVETMDLFEVSLEEEKLLRKKYEDFTRKEEDMFKELEKRYDKSRDRLKKDYKDGIDRIREERKLDE